MGHFGRRRCSGENPRSKSPDEVFGTDELFGRRLGTSEFANAGETGKKGQPHLEGSSLVGAKS
jgi:hypothetical protein